MELVHIHESSHKEAIQIFVTNKELNKTKNSSFTEDEYGKCFELSHSKIYI